MTGDTKLNVILGQSHAIKEIYNVKKQELQQQRDSRFGEKQAAKDKDRIVRYDSCNKVVDKPNTDKKNENDSHKHKSERKPSEAVEDMPTDSNLDIMV